MKWGKEIGFMLYIYSFHFGIIIFAFYPEQVVRRCFLTLFRVGGGGGEQKGSPLRDFPLYILQT